MLKKENDLVNEGELIAYIKSNVDVISLLKLEQALSADKSNTINYTNYQLGDLQGQLNRLTSATQDLRVFNQNDLATKQILELENQIRSYKQLNINLEAQYQLLQRELSLMKEKFTADSLLYAQAVIARLDFNASLSSYLAQQRSFKNAEVTMINNRIQIGQMRKQISELQAQRREKINQLTVNYENSENELRSQIKKWKEANLFISPMSGHLAYLAYFENGQFIESGKPLLSVVPATNQIFARAELPVVGSGKVKEGQAVNIRLQNYPSEQFGMLTGFVETISLMPNQDKYMVKIILPQGMLSSYKKLLPFRQQLQGETEIITKDLRLLDRLFYSFRELIQNR